MVEVGAAVPGASGAGALRVERAGVLGMAGVAQVEHAARSEAPRRAPGARRHHAVEHVDPARHRCQQVIRRADAHEVARPVRRQTRHRAVQHRKHGRLAFAHSQSADRVALEADGGQRPRRCCPQVREHAALHDAELAVARTRQEGVAGACGPAHRQRHAGLRLRGRGGEGGALVQRHGDGGVELVLDLRGAFGRQAVGAAIQVGAEGDAALVHRA